MNMTTLMAYKKETSIPVSVFEIQVLFCAHAGCMAFKKYAPGGRFNITFSLKEFKKSMHLTGAQVLKSVHPATKMYTPGAGCTLNFEHCCLYKTLPAAHNGKNSEELTRR